MMTSLTMMSIATGRYEMFALPFAACNAVHPGRRSEIIVDFGRGGDVVASMPDNVRCHTLVREMPERFRGWQEVPRAALVCNYRGRNPAGSVRWLLTPFLNGEYTYICDCDILNTSDSIVFFHANIMEIIAKPYSNIIRPPREEGEQKRLTGCHFCSTVDFYTQDFENAQEAAATAIEGGDYAYYDERLLYHLIEQTHGLPPDSFRSYSLRPLHGLHLSLTRNPQDRCGWNINAESVAEYRKLQREPMWREASEHFDPQYKALLERMEAAL